MSGNQLPLSNIINISVSSTPTGVSAFNTSNLALFTADTPSPAFSSGYKIYFEPTSVATDFGSSTNTAIMANAVFSQQPNILAAGGYLVVIPYIGAETLATAIARTSSLVQYFGIMSTTIESQVDMLAAAAVIQASPTMLGFFVQDSTGAIAPGGSLDLLRTGSLTQSRGLIYIDSSLSGLNALTMQAAYAGRALSTNFNGSNTTQTMNLKTLAGVQPDPGMNGTQYAATLLAGADAYVSFQGQPAVLCTGANNYFDQVYNLAWVVGALQVAGFNYLLQASTKVPQTESGMDGLKSAYRTVLTQAVSNQYLAPGLWTSPTTFGDQVKMLANIAQTGYYIYSSPISQQLSTARAARQAPLIQVAMKQAGSIQSSSVIVNVNA